MQSQPPTLLCRYGYDPLDRLTSHTLSETPERQRFYCKSRLTTEIQGAMKHSIVQHDDLLLAQQQVESETLDTTLLITDQQRSVLHTLKTDHPLRPIIYSPYGHRGTANGLLSLLGFNGERPDPVTEHYLLGNGYRAFNPVLMRFNSPDSLSPFGKGGLNSYAYCLGDPINLYDPNGNFAFPRFLSRAYKRIQKILGTNSRTYMSSPAKTFDTITSTSTSTSKPFTYTDYQYGGRRHSSSQTPPFSPSAEALKKWDLIGYHGSSRENANSLMAGLDPKHMDSNNGLLGGRGFYTTPDYNWAIGYSSNIFQRGTPQVYGAFTKNFDKLKLGRDYKFRVQSGFPVTRRNLEVIIQESAYRKIIIRAMNVRGNVILPKSYEAPF